MAGDSAAPSWQYVNDNNNRSNFEFSQPPPVHIPRAWERAPQPSRLARHKGRKVWKRPEVRARDDVGRHETPVIEEERNPLRDISSNTPRPIKRLRVKDGLATGEYNGGGGFANYFATLRDGFADTPKRKIITLATEKPQEIQKEDEESKAIRQETVQANEGQIELPKIDIEEDLLNVPESPTQADVRTLLQSNGMGKASFEVGSEPPILDSEISTTKYEAKNNEIESESVDVTIQTNLEDTKHAGPICSSENPANTPKHKETLVESTPPVVNIAEESTVELKGADRDNPMLQENAPIPVPTQINAKTIPQIGVESPQEFNSPQIGATLLRRESLRSKGSPRKRGSARKRASPQKSHGLKKRDTLQEREILQQFNAASSPTNNIVGKDLVHENGGPSPGKLPPKPTLSGDEELSQVTTLTGSCKDGPPSSSPPPPTAEKSADTEIGSVAAEQIIVKDKDTDKATEAVELSQRSNDETTGDASSNDALVPEQASSNADQADECMAGSEIQQPEQSVTTAVCDNIEASTRKTRSGARISDDTSMLKDFLNRAQAKKAAKNVPLLSAEVPNLQSSPTRRSPRKALEPQNKDIGSPQKKKKPSKGQSTPPRKELVEENDSSDDQETTCEPASFRRSTRTRLPAPSKTPPGAPTFIPVRRGEGSDPIVLQKSQAQEMAIVTRANTRRNKGQSKPPALALQELPPVSPVKLTSKERADYAKKVAWAERLASFQESRDTPEEPEEQAQQQQQKPKVRRMRGLGAVNGTPAKKSAAMAPSSNGTPAPKRRSKTR